MYHLIKIRARFFLQVDVPIQKVRAQHFLKNDEHSSKNSSPNQVLLDLNKTEN